MRVELVSLAISATLGMSPPAAQGDGPESGAAASPLAAEASGPGGATKVSERLQDPEARRYYEAANRHFAEGRYALAAQQLGFAYAVERVPDLLLQRALMLDAAGRCREGLPLLEDFLRAGPSGGRAVRAQRMIDDCRKRSELETTTAGGAASTGPAQAPSRPVEPATAAESGAEAAPTVVDPWYRDVAGGVLLGVGLAALTTGAGLMIASGAPRRRAATSALHSDYADNLRQATILQSFGSGALVGGVALTIGAIIRYRGRRPDAERWPRASAWLDHRGGGVALLGRF